MPQDTETAFSTVRLLPATDVIDDRDLESINTRFAKTQLGTDDIFVFPAVASTDAVDTYYTVMDPATTLRNYEEDLRAGQSLLDSHFVYSLPLGSSFEAELQRIDQAEGVAATYQVLARYYMLRHHIAGNTDTEQVRRGILGGINRKMSIGFGGNDLQYISEIDGLGLWESDYYPGQRLKDGKRSVFRIVNARALETSIVYKNSAPGALVQRIGELAKQRKVEPADIAHLEQSWGVRFPDIPSIHVIPDLAPLRAAKEEPPLPQGDTDVDPQEFVRSVLAQVQQRVGKTLSQSTRNKLDSAIGRLQSATAGIDEAATEIAALLESADSTATEEDRQVRAALGDRASVEGVTQLQALAKAGQVYAEGLIKDAIDARTAVLGDDFTTEKAEKYRARLTRSIVDDLDYIQEEAGYWQEAKARTFTAGRPSKQVADVLEISERVVTPSQAPQGDAAGDEYLEITERAAN